jgi:CRP-like cAMP-binding protein
MAATNATIDLFSALPQDLSALLFANAKPIHLAADQTLFVTGDPGDGCYRIEKGLLKVSIVSASGAASLFLQVAIRPSLRRPRSDCPERALNAPAGFYESLRGGLGAGQPEKALSHCII